MTTITTARSGGLIIPYTSSTKRTKWIPLVKTTDITAAAISGTALGTYLIPKAVARFTADSSGVWVMELKMSITYDSGTRTGIGVSFVKTSVVTDSTANNNQSGASTHDGADKSLATVIFPDVSGFSQYHTSQTTSTSYFDLKILLKQEPTYYTTAANMEGVLAADVYIAPATAGTVGVIDNTAGNTTGTPIKGRTDGNAAAAGYIGELQQITASGVNTAASGTYGDITSKSLTPGRYGVNWGCLLYNNGAANFIEGVIGLGSSSGNSSQDLITGINSFDSYKAASTTSLQATGYSVVDVTSTQITILNSATGTGTVRSGTTLYLKVLVNDNSGGPVTGRGYISAIRIA